MIKPEHYLFSWTNILLIILFFTITPLTLFASTVSLISISSVNKESIKDKTAEESLVSRGQFLASAPGNNLPSVSAEIVSLDARSEILSNYLKKSDSPLLEYADVLVEKSDKYGLDYRLLPAIAQKESGLCRVIPEGSHNCWGWGIHSKGTLKFDNYEEAIETVAKGLREKYLDMGYVTPEQIMKKYAHPDSTTWAEGVSLYMSQLE